MSIYTVAGFFARGELTTAAKWFTKVWTPFNTALPARWGASNTWTAINTFANGWAAATSTTIYGTPSWRMRDSVVQLRGAIKGTALNGTLPAFTLPVGMRPSADGMFVCPAGSGTARVNVFADGRVTVEIVSTGGSTPGNFTNLVILSPITFPIA